MSQINNLLNHNIGIDQFLASQTNEHIPTAKPIASNSIFDANLGNHFNMSNIKGQLENMLTPSMGDGEILRPDMFNRTINNFSDSVKNAADNGAHISSNVQAMVNDVLNPLIENRELLNIYTNLMVAG